MLPLAELGGLDFHQPHAGARQQRICIENL